MEWNFTNEAHAKDWSLVAHGNGKKGSLKLKHERNLRTDTFGAVKKQSAPSTPPKKAVAPKAKEEKKPVAAPAPAEKPVAKPAKKPEPKIDSEAAMINWIENLPMSGGECSMLKEDIVEKDMNYFFRTALKSKCEHPVIYAIAMYADDWIANLEHVYKDFDLVTCEMGDAKNDVIECFVRLTPEHPQTGWQLKTEAYGVHWAHKVTEKELD